MLNQVGIYSCRKFIQDEPFSLRELFEIPDDDSELDEIYVALTRCVSHCIMGLKGLASTTTNEGSSTEYHKEYNDKAVLKLLLGHIKAGSIAEEVVHSDEVIYSLPENSVGFHGVLDLLICSTLTEDCAPSLVLKYGSEQLDLSHPLFSETKSVNSYNLVGENVQKSTEVNLVAGSSEDKYGKDIRDIQSCCQPAVQLLTVSQITAENPLVLIYANRQVFRPFIYYKTTDMLLTTKEAYVWNVTENKLDVHGVLLMAILSAKGLLDSTSASTRRDVVIEVLDICKSDALDYLDRRGVSKNLFMNW